MPGRLEPTVRIVHFVDAERDLPAERADTVVGVLDPAFTPMPEGRPEPSSSASACTSARTLGESGPKAAQSR